MKKNSLFLINLIFWSSPLLFWIGWQIVLVFPHSLWVLALVSALILLPVAFESSGRRFSWATLFIFINLSLLLGSFYLFIALIASPWVLRLLWLFIIWYLYRYLWEAKKYAGSGQTDFFAPIAAVGGLVSVFFSAASLFGLQSFLSLSPWPLLAALLPVLFLNIRAAAFIQGWNKSQDFPLWPVLSLFVAQIVMMLTFLPLNYLISGILSALAYYSAFNFVRLYLNNNLKGHKIRNYAWFTAISLAVILLSARWL